MDSFLCFWECFGFIVFESLVFLGSEWDFLEFFFSNLSFCYFLECFSDIFGFFQLFFLEILLFSCFLCCVCDLLVYDEEIMVGWVFDDFNFNIICFFCVCFFVFLFSVQIFDFWFSVFSFKFVDVSGSKDVFVFGGFGFVFSDCRFCFVLDEFQFCNGYMGGFFWWVESGVWVYLSFLVLCKELELLVENEGSEVLVLFELFFVYFIIFWNFLWYF